MPGLGAVSSPAVPPGQPEPCSRFLHPHHSSASYDLPQTAADDRYRAPSYGGQQNSDAHTFVWLTVNASYLKFKHGQIIMKIKMVVHMY